MKKLIIILVIAYAAYRGFAVETGQTLSEEVLQTAHVTMYSLTSCGYCKARAKDFREMGLPFKEYYINTDRGRQDELNAKLRAAGFAPRSYGTPILEINGVMLPNNPPMSEIMTALNSG